MTHLGEEEEKYADGEAAGLRERAGLNFDCTQILPRDLDQRPPASAAAASKQQCDV